MSKRLLLEKTDPDKKKLKGPERDPLQEVLDAQNPFEILGIEFDKNIEEKQLTKAYRKRCMKVHPDRHFERRQKATLAFKKLDDAYRDMCLPEEREKIVRAVLMARQRRKAWSALRFNKKEKRGFKAGGVMEKFHLKRQQKELDEMKKHSEKQKLEEEEEENRFSEHINNDCSSDSDSDILVVKKPRKRRRGL